jgi:hypothetical protein
MAGRYIDACNKKEVVPKKLLQQKITLARR